MDALVLVAAQQAWQDLRSQPLTYFHRQGRIGQVIQVLQEKGAALPQLVVEGANEGNIYRADFFDGGMPFPKDANLIIGNPPWGSTATDKTPAGRWCAEHGKPVPDKQIAAAFVWKAPFFRVRRVQYEPDQAEQAR